MKILVAIKRVIDPYVTVRVKADGTGVETQNVKMAVNPFDEIAVEEAIRLREKGQASEVIVVSIGSSLCQESLRAALALGADRAILVQHDEDLEPLNVAKCLQQIAQKEQPGLIIMGKQSIDGDNNKTREMLAALLAWPQGTFASAIHLDNGKVTVTREIDGGLETLALQCPALITTDLRLNEPRYATLPNIMKAKSKPLEIINATDLKVNLKSHQTVTQIEPPKERCAGEILETVADLVDRLRTKEGVI